MAEGGHELADKSQFTECWRRTTQSPYLMRLALSAGIGGLLFGYDTGIYIILNHTHVNIAVAFHNSLFFNKFFHV